MDAGDTARTYEGVAGRTGRGVAVTVRRGVVEVSEVTRAPGGRPQGPDPGLHPGEYLRAVRVILGEARQWVRGHDAGMPLDA